MARGSSTAAGGTAGKILFVTLPTGHNQARVKFRDFDGRIRLVARHGRSLRRSDRRVDARLGARPSLAGGAARLVDRHRAHLPLGHREPGRPGARRAAAARGYDRRGQSRAARDRGSARPERGQVLEGVLVRHVPDGHRGRRDVSQPRARLVDANQRGKKSPRALTPSETATLIAWLRANERAVALDIPDLVDWMLATGCRIGEALALRHGPNADGRPLLDLDANTWEVNATVIRVPEQAGRAAASEDRRRLARGCRARLRGRDGPCTADRRRWRGFTAPLAKTARDPSNASADLRQLLDSFDCEVCAGTGFQLVPDGRG